MLWLVGMRPPAGRGMVTNRNKLYSTLGFYAAPAWVPLPPSLPLYPLRALLHHPPSFLPPILPSSPPVSFSTPDSVSLHPSYLRSLS